MEKTSLQKLYLGLFIIVSTVLLVVALYFIGSKQNLFGKNVKISAIFSDVNGLQPGNNVRYSGINVGTVKRITMINDTTICVDMIIEEKMLKHLKKNAVTTIKTDGLVGSMTISIVPVNENSPQLQPGDTLVSIKKASTDEMLNTLGTTNENISKLVLDLLKVTESLNKGEGTLGVLLNDKETATNLKQTVLNLQSASISANNTIKDLNAIVAKVNYDKSLAAVLLSDSITADRMKSIIANLDSSSNEINAVIKNIDEVVLEIKNGEGPLDYMINDTSFAIYLDETMQNIRTGSILLNENLEALKHNFLFRRYFKKLEKQEE